MSDYKKKYLKYKNKYLKSGGQKCSDNRYNLIWKGLQDTDDKYRKDIHINQTHGRQTLHLYVNIAP